MIYLTYSVFKGATAPANPWGAKGLEWTTTSPPPTFNFDREVVVDEPAYNYRPHGRSPLADGHEPSLMGRDMIGHSTGHDGASPAVGGHGHHPRLQHHFYSMEQQLEASILGMWIFLVTEVMFFGGLFMAYIVYRTTYPLAWEKGSQELNVILGGINTAVLICSSLTMVLAVRSAQVGSRRGQIVNLILTIMFGSTFLVVKYFEYAAKFEHHLVPGPHFAPGAGARPTARRSSSRCTSS